MNSLSEAQERQLTEGTGTTDLTCICPHCNVTFQFPATGVAICDDETQAKIEQMQADWDRECRATAEKLTETRRALDESIGEEIQQYALPRLQKCLDVITNATLKQDKSRDWRERQKRHYLSIYE